MSVTLGIDTSNYTTSVACSENGRVTLNRRIMLSVEQGERGLRQSDAVFAHTVNLPRAFEDFGAGEFSAVGVSAYPRDAENSYMPCFLAGVASASAVAASCGIALYRFSHQAGHVAAALYSCGREDLHRGEFIAFHVSGGTTELLHVRSGSIEKLGGTLDISAGKAVDRIGVKLGISFPCGKELEKLADGVSVIKPPKISVNGFNCNFSGLENLADKLISDKAEPSYIAAFTLAFISATIEKMTENALAAHPGLPVIYAGGVMSNSFIKEKIQKRFGGLFAAPEYSCDNAAGIARLAELKYNGEI